MWYDQYGRWCNLRQNKIRKEIIFVTRELSSRMDQNQDLHRVIKTENTDDSETTPKPQGTDKIQEQQRLVESINLQVQNLKQKTPSEIIEFIIWHDITDLEPGYKEKLNRVATTKPEDYEEFCKSLKYTENRFENYSNEDLLKKLSQIVTLLSEQHSNYRKLLLSVDFYVLYQISTNIGLSLEGINLPSEKMVDTYLRVGKRMHSIYLVIPAGSHYCIETLSFTKMRKLNDDSFNRLAL